MIAYVVLAALQAAAVPAAAPATHATPAPVVTAANTDNKLICKQEDEVGTRLGGHKVCMTRAQWRENTLQEHDALKHAQDNLGYVHN